MMLEQIISIVREAGDIVLGAHNISAQTQEKGGAADLVTAYDLAVEKFLHEKLTALMPEAHFLGEETGNDIDPNVGWTYIVDPIDGTTNFVRHLNQSAISVGLAKDGILEYGVVFDPFKNEMFSAQRGHGAFLNSSPIHVSDRPLEKGIFGMGTALYTREFLEPTMSVTTQLFKRSCDFRRMGAAALDLCYVAAGRFDAFFEFSLAPWDFAAASLMITEAGGQLCTMQGEPVTITRCGIWASNPINFDILKELEF
ncbi:MAG: inositol monophosphatase [Oscillospiraceae bacterium]|nr:inositol monophosphatase [Oscillospiraceae bacterium]